MLGAHSLNAARPWNSVYSGEIEREHGKFAINLNESDGQKRIDKCLSCTLPECTNCYAQKDRIIYGQISLFAEAIV